MATTTIPANPAADALAHLVAPEGFALPSGPSGYGEWLNKAEADETEAHERAQFARAIVSHEVYQYHLVRKVGLTKTADALGLANPETGKALRGTSVTRLALLGLAVSHGVTDTLGVRGAINTAMNRRSRSPEDVTAIITAWATNEKRSDRSLCVALTAGEDKTLQEQFIAALKRAATGVGNASVMEGVTVTEEAGEYLRAIMEGAAEIVG
jgi:hypothetical protein